MFEVLVLVTTFTATVPYLLSTAAQIHWLASGQGHRVSRARLVRDAVLAAVAAAFSLRLVAGSGHAAVYQGVLFLFAGVLVYAWMSARNRRKAASAGTRPVGRSPIGRIPGTGGASGALHGHSWHVQEVVPVNRPVRCADRVVLAVLMALVAVLGTRAGATAVTPPGPDRPPASVPAEPAGEAPQDTSVTQQPPPARAEGRTARACAPTEDGPAGEAAPGPYVSGVAVSAAPPRAPAMRSVVLRC